MRRKVSLAILLSLIAVSVASGHTSEPIQPLTQDAFILIVPDSKVKEKVKAPVIKDRIGSLVLRKGSLNQPEARPRVVVKTRGKQPVPIGRSISGLASYYCSYGGSPCPRGFGPGFNGAAAGPDLRVAMGGGEATTAPKPWMGKKVTVCGSLACARVTLVDWCQCYRNEPHEKVIDLFHEVFKTVGASKGSVRISW